MSLSMRRVGEGFVHPAQAGSVVGDEGFGKRLRQHDLGGANAQRDQARTEIQSRREGEVDPEQVRDQRLHCSAAVHRSHPRAGQPQCVHGLVSICMGLKPICAGFKLI